MKVPVADLLAIMKSATGMAEADYRADIKRQILDDKLVEVFVRPRVHVTETDVQKVYDAWVKDQTTGPSAPIVLRILVLHLPKDATDADRKNTEALAATIATRARSGSDFCALVTKYSHDRSTTSKCGASGPFAPTTLVPEIAPVALPLKPGETSAPVLLIDPLLGRQSYLVIQRATPPAPSLASVKDKMKARALAEPLERERKTWLLDLRRQRYVVKP